MLKSYVRGAARPGTAASSKAMVAKATPDYVQAYTIRTPTAQHSYIGASADALVRNSEAPPDHGAPDRRGCRRGQFMKGARTTVRAPVGAASDLRRASAP